MVSELARPVLVAVHADWLSAAHIAHGKGAESKEHPMCTLKRAVHMIAKVKHQRVRGDSGQPWSEAECAIASMMRTDMVCANHCWCYDPSRFTLCCKIPFGYQSAESRQQVPEHWCA